MTATIQPGQHLQRGGSMSYPEAPEGWEKIHSHYCGQGLMRFTLKKDEGSTIMDGPRAPKVPGFVCTFVGHSPTQTTYSYKEVRNA